MQFRTIVPIDSPDFNISHQDKILMLGSCFSQHIGAKLEQDKFDINLNPFGILYNPLSIGQSIELLLSGNGLDEQAVFEHQGLWSSFYYHGSFSNANKTECLRAINASMSKAKEYLLASNYLFITFGTSYVYELVSTKQIVSNCHKLPASDFVRYRLSVEDIVTYWDNLISKLKENNPKLKIIFTVSPIRHLRDGAHDNQLSKAILLLGIEKLTAKYVHASYFPSYEIVLDELRDYRFYNEDMVHPTSQTTAYIYQQLSQTYFDEETQQLASEWNKLYLALHHRPINAHSEAHKLFLKQTLLRLYQLGTKYPYLCLTAEIDKLMTQLED